MAPATTTDDDLKLFYAFVQLAPNKARMAEVAGFMGLKESATYVLPPTPTSTTLSP